MSFTSYWFVLAVGVIIFLYYIIPKRVQWMFLLAASYLIYASAGWQCIVYISITTLVTYIAARVIDSLTQKRKRFFSENKLEKAEKKQYKEKIKKKQKCLVWMAIIADLCLLVMLKYSGFIGLKISDVFQGIIVPLGISFYTLQAIGYLIDVYNEKYEAQRNYGKLALFMGFFPQLSQGPISRYDDLSKTLYEMHGFDASVVALGAQRILWGYFKKLVIADRVAVGLNTLLKAPSEYTGVYFIVAATFYAIQLYADFTGGIDIAIGIAQTLGIKLKENFVRPFFSKSIKEYWNRWHITMGSWFTDYVFYPVSVSKTFLKISKRARNVLGDGIGKKVPVYLATIIVWSLTGLWHGASWNFVVWGLANCVVILISQELIPIYRKFHKRFKVADKMWYKMFCVVRTIILMSMLRMFDCFTDVTVTVKWFASIFINCNPAVLWNGSLLHIGLTVEDYVIIILGVLILVTVSMLQRKQSVRERIKHMPYPVRVAVWLSLFVVVILMGMYGQGYEASDFIYNRF